MSHIDGIRHIFLSFIGSISELDTLIPCTNGIDLILAHFCFQSLVNAKGNICRLLVNSSDNCAGICVKSIFAAGISNLSYSISYDLLNINISVCCDLSHNKNKACCSRCFAGNTTHWILLDQSVKNGIGNSVTHFVRMAFSNRFGSK